MTRRRSPKQADLLAELPPISYVWETPIGVRGVASTTAAAASRSPSNRSA